MTNLEKFNELVERVRAGMACEWMECKRESCPYYRLDCIDNYREDIRDLTILLVRAYAHSGECGFGKEEYVE